MKQIINLSILLISAFVLYGCHSDKATYCCNSKTCNTSKGFFTGSNLITSDTFLEPQPLACLLKGAEQFERKEALKEEIFSQVLDIEEMESGYLFKFKDADHFLLKLADYVKVEQACCPFFKFDFTVLPYNKGIVLMVSGPAEAKQLIELFVNEIQDERK